MYFHDKKSIKICLEISFDDKKMWKEKMTKIWNIEKQKNIKNSKMNSKINLNHISPNLPNNFYQSSLSPSIHPSSSSSHHHHHHPWQPLLKLDSHPRALPIPKY